MKPRAMRETGQNDLFKARLDQVIDLGHELVLLALAIDWVFLETAFGAVYSPVPGQPPLPVRLMAGLAILKSMYNLSDEELTRRPAQASHTLRPAGLLSSPRLPLSRGSGTASYPDRPLASF